MYLLKKFFFYNDKFNYSPTSTLSLVQIFDNNTNTNGATKSTITPTVVAKSINLPLIIGCAAGGVGFLALTGFLIYYIIKVKRRNAMNE